MTPDYWTTATKRLRRDPTLRTIIRQHPSVSLRKRGSAFGTLLRAIVGQQISVKAAQSIWNRFELEVGKITPDTVLDAAPEALRSCGLSVQKISYMRDLARHFAQGSINPRRFASLSDEELITALCEVRGIGRWTAEMFLIFNLQRPDVFPVQDIGLIRAVERNYFGGKTASRCAISALGESWRPYRTVATWYLWRSLDPVPVEY